MLASSAHRHTMVDDEAGNDGNADRSPGKAPAGPPPPPPANPADLQDPVYLPRYKLRVSALFNDGPVLNFSPPIVANLMRHAEKMAREPLSSQHGGGGSATPLSSARRVEVRDPSAGQTYPRPYAHRVIARLDETMEPNRKTNDIPDSILIEARINQCRPKTGADSVLASAGYVLLAEISERAYAYTKVMTAVRVVRPRFRDLTAAYANALASEALRFDGKRPVIDGRAAADMYALKLIDFHQPSMETKKEFLQRFLLEVDMLNLVCHPNVVSVVEVFPTRDHVCIVMELATTDLDAYVRSHGPMPEVLAAVFCQQLLHAVDYLHSNHIAHRGIRSDKVLLFPNDVVKLSLCGHSRVFQKESLCSTFLGGGQYVPPECLTDTPYEAKPVDIWALGILVYLMVYGILPFDDGDPIKMIRDMKERDFRRPREQPQLSSRVTRLINCMLDPNPIYRIGMAEIQRQSWLAEAKQAPQCASPPCNTRMPPSEAFHCFDKCC